MTQSIDFDFKILWGFQQTVPSLHSRTHTHARTHTHENFTESQLVDELWRSCGLILGTKGFLKCVLCCLRVHLG